jgi:hypothetical protein
MEPNLTSVEEVDNTLTNTDNDMLQIASSDRTVDKTAEIQTFLAQSSYDVIDTFVCNLAMDWNVGNSL